MTSSQASPRTSFAVFSARIVLALAVGVMCFGVLVGCTDSDAPKVDIREETREEAVPFDTVYEEDPLSPVGQETVTREGREGRKRVTYKQEWYEGEMLREEPISKDWMLIQAPVDRIVSRGTSQGMIIYFADSDEIRAVSPTGGESRLLASGRLFPPALAADPTRPVIAYVEEGDWAIHVHDLSTGASKRHDIFSNDVSLTRLRFSPDGTTLYFISMSGVQPRPLDRYLYAMDVASGQVREVATLSLQADSLVVSSDGEKIAFMSGTGGIAVVNRNGSDRQDLEMKEGGRPFAFSSDGSKLFISRMSDYMSVDIANDNSMSNMQAATVPLSKYSRMNLTNTMLVDESGAVYGIGADGFQLVKDSRIARGSSSIAGFASSPDGESIVYSSDMNGSYDIYVSSNSNRITNDVGAERYPLWVGWSLP